MKDKTLIPKGQYCYVLDITVQRDKDKFSIPIVRCPYSTSKELNGVQVPWCSYLKSGGVSNNWSKEEWDKIIEYFGSENNVFDHLDADLLWDDCKECGVNDDNEELPRTELIAWINRIKELKKE